MKKGLLIVTAILLCFFVLAGCADTQGDKQDAVPGITLDENTLASYTKLISFKTDGYTRQSIKNFNARLLLEYAELLEAQAAVAKAGLSSEDENHDFITVTLRASLGELYAEKMDEKAFFSGHADRGRLSEPLNKTEEAIFEAQGPAYDFWFSAEYYLEYEILSPDSLTVAERDNAFCTFENELQAYVDGLNEMELDHTITKELNERAAAILQEVAPDGMAISCEIKVSSGNEDLQFDAYFSDEEYQKLFALQFDGYEDMLVSEFQNKVWPLTDTDEYRDLLDRFSGSRTFYEQKDHDETACFYFYILEPLIAEKWELWTFSDTITPDNPELSYRALLEYVLTLYIRDADALTVREYNNTRIAVVRALQDLINTKTKEDLRDYSAMEKAIDNEINSIQQQLGTNAIQLDVEYSFMPLDGPLDFYNKNVDSGSIESEQEIRRTAYGTKEDYASLLALKTPSYADMAVADLNAKLLDWADEDYGRMERIDADCRWNDYQVDLSDDDLSFVRLTICLSGQENGKHVQSLYTGNPEADPVYEEYLPQRTAKRERNHTARCDLYYQFSYHITDKETVTVGERDGCVGGMIRAIQEFWNKTSVNDLLRMSKDDIAMYLTSLADEYSNDRILITVNKERIHFESSAEDSRLNWNISNTQGPLSNKLTYSNLDSESSVREVREMLTNAGIKTEYADTVLDWVTDYNNCMRECSSFTLIGDFITIDGMTVDYGDYPSMSREWYKRNHRNYHDVLCRIAAFELMQDNISVGEVIPKEKFDCWDENTAWLYTDGDILFGREAVEGEHKAYVPFPLIAWGEDIIANYFTLFNPIHISEGCSEQEMFQVIQAKWSEQGISFTENDISLITFWTQSSDRICASHAAVLIGTDNGYLLFEKTNPESPYAATKFSSTGEVKQYLYEMMSLDYVRYDSQIGTYIILKNDKII